MEDSNSCDFLLPEDKLTPDYLNQYLNDTVDILKNQKEKININRNSRSHTVDAYNSENLRSNDYFEAHIKLIQKLNNSLKCEIESLIKKNNEVSILKILCQRNYLLNKLMTVLFEKSNKLIQKEQILNNNKLKRYHSRGKYQKDITITYQDILMEHKNHGIKVPHIGLKYEQMIYYNNTLKNKKYETNRSSSVDHFSSDTRRKFFSKNNSINKSNIIVKNKNKNEEINKNLNDGNLTSYRQNPSKNKKKYKFVKKIRPKCHSTKTSGSVIKTFRENNEFKENHSKLNKKRKNRNSNCLIDWEKLNLDKLNEISSIIVDKKKNTKKK